MPLADKHNIMNHLKRVIVDFKKLTPELLKMLVDRYPDGYGDEDIVNFKGVKGERVKAVEVDTEDTRYLVKISVQLAESMANFDNDDAGDFNPEGLYGIPDASFYDSEEG